MQNNNLTTIKNPYSTEKQSENAVTAGSLLDFGSKIHLKTSLALSFKCTGPIKEFSNSFNGPMTVLWLFAKSC